MTEARGDPGKFILDMLKYLWFVILCQDIFIAIVGHIWLMVGHNFGTQCSSKSRTFYVFATTNTALGW